MRKQRREELWQYILQIVKDAKEKKDTCRFRSKFGSICITPITNTADKNLLKHFSKREIRELISTALKME